MKHKADGTLRARVTERGYEQKPAEHYEETGILSPVVNEASTFITLTLIVLARMYAEMNDMQGAFLKNCSPMERNFACTYLKDLRSFIQWMWFCYY